MPSSASVQVRVYDITQATQTVDWTNTGVVERAVGLSKSCYYSSPTLTAGRAYQVDWRDAASPTAVASETIYEQQSSVDALISSRSTFTGGAVASVSGAVGSITSPVTVGTNNDKTGYTATSVTNPVTVGTVNDKTGYALSSAYNSAMYAASQSSVNAIPTDPVRVTDSRVAMLDASVSSRLAAAAYTAPTDTLIPLIKAQTDKLQFDISNNVMSVATVTVDTDEIADSLLNASAAGYNAVGTIGYKINSAASAGDPWSADLTAYGAGSAGYLINSATLKNVTYPVMQGTVYAPVAQAARTVVVVRKDSPRVLFDLGGDYTGWTPSFAAKLSTSPTVTTYAIGPVTAVWTNAAEGEGYFDLASTDTDISETQYFAELVLTSGSSRYTAMKFTVKILPRVVN